MNSVKKTSFYQSHSRYWSLMRKPKAVNDDLSDSAKALVRPTIIPKEFGSDSSYDLVYILKASEYNPDLQMSLRSVAKYCTFRNIWLVGYKPSWTKNVKYIPTKQNQDKWKNSIINYTAACMNDEISDDFILMNDDFFALKPIRNWKANLNVCLGTLEEEVAKNIDNPKRSRWKYGFDYAVDILPKLNARTTYNYETHLPIIINKHKFLEMMNLPLIREFTVTKKVLHKRSVYKNLYPEYISAKPRIIKDVKITIGQDLDDCWLKESWLSVFDDTVGNLIGFPKLNKFLLSMFPDKCRYER